MRASFARLRDMTLRPGDSAIDFVNALAMYERHDPRFSRIAPRRNQLRDVDGKPLCIWCNGSLPKRRRVFCSEHCEEEVWVRISPSYARARVYTRDRSICALCGFDSEDFAKRFNALNLRPESKVAEALLRWLDLPSLYIRRSWDYERQGYRLILSAPWEMDHIVPVVEGGGSCGLDGLRTVCRWCHRRETQALRRRRRKDDADPIPSPRRPFSLQVALSL